MNTSSSLTSGRPGRFVRNVAFALAGLGCGLALGWDAALYLKHHPAVKIAWSDELALLLAVACAAMGLWWGALTLSRQGMALLLDPQAPDATRAIPPGRRLYFRWQAVVILLAGMMLATPPTLTLMAAEVGDQVRLAAFGGLALAFAVQSGLNLALWRRSDEIVRRCINESGAVCFWVFQGGLFLWAAAERVGFAPHASAWDIEVLLMGLYLIGSAAVFSRRGLG